MTGQGAKDGKTKGKAIVLFSDGTGNSSGKLFKTNVWRMYEAVDLGPSAEGKRPQVAYYDDGVGSSGFRPLAMLGGVFGVGLKRNVLDIYRYACRNYRPGKGQEPGDEAVEGGDEIYGLGFSRGAFTMRTAIAMIAKVGLADAEDDAELNRRAREAWRAYRVGCAPARNLAPLNMLRKLLYLGRDRKRMQAEAVERERARNYHPAIRFIGVWDTVAAYGGPILEITRAIDDWIFPLSMPNYELNERVRCARHALALDDSRDAFHPLLWDEVHEDKLVKQGKVAGDRLRQVWFAGMHADVGGGYPDESLSYVSLLWMLEEAKAADLRPLEIITDRYRALANSFGPLHDSRAGLGSYYRYQPRRIGAWIDPPEPSTEVLRDPSMRHADGTPRGLLRKVEVHESVIARIANGTDSYAPIVLPGGLRIDPPQSEGENAPQADSQAASTGKPEKPLPLISESVRKRVESDAELGKARAKASEWLWDGVLRRRLIYFATLAATAWLVLMPFLRSWTRVEGYCSDDRCVLPWLISQTKIIVPKFAERWIDAWATNPVAFAVGLATVLVLLWFGRRTEARLRDGSLRIWDDALERPRGPAKPHWALSRFAWAALRAIRTSRVYQWLISFAKWKFLPFVIGVAMLLSSLYAIAVGLNRIWLRGAESRGAMCAAAAERPGPVISGPIQVELDISQPCTPARVRVRAGDQFIVTFREVRSPSGERRGAWYDRSHAGTPRGIEAGRMGPIGRLAAPFRRVAGAGYIQPLAEIRGSGVTGRRIDLFALSVREREGEQDVYDAVFEAKRPGALFFSVNDVSIFGWHRFFYGNNRGTATLTVTPYRPVSRYRPR